eukprot:TRINITY_DN2442_c0_g1_i2.p1 TRINITY_DN2442_c0_g1~~TRINITY_DN2442_c0_g1_i2.p1  ORF type:complete len:575 (+),score=116.53 TRINITY_DN2442_c0_g1_i2:76-1800(+)
MTITVDFSRCHYKLVKKCMRNMGWKLTDGKSHWLIRWVDSGGVDVLIVKQLNPFQKLNHFPAMSEICTKCGLATRISRLSMDFTKKVFGFHPQSWILPLQLAQLKHHMSSKKFKNQTIIIKPDVSSRGRGIILIKDSSQIPTNFTEDESAVAQLYIPNPLTIDDFKFDLRIYVLVTSCHPKLRAFVHKEGMVRICTAKYEKPKVDNLANTYQHLTNYSINKHNKKCFKKVKGNEALMAREGSKWSLSAFWEWVAEQGKDSKAIEKQICNIIGKTLLAVGWSLRHSYRTCFAEDNVGNRCFELLGFDVMLDSKWKPHLLEVNHSPSLHSDSQLDKMVKTAVVSDTLKIISQDPRDFMATASTTTTHTTASSSSSSKSVSNEATNNNNNKENKINGSKSNNNSQKNIKRPSLKAKTVSRLMNKDLRKRTTIKQSSADREADTIAIEELMRAHEDRNMGNFHRILPSEDPVEEELNNRIFSAAPSLMKETDTMRQKRENALQLRASIEARWKAEQEMLKKPSKPSCPLAEPVRPKVTRSNSSIGAFKLQTEERSKRRRRSRTIRGGGVERDDSFPLP